MNANYFQRVRALTATQFYINNATREQIRLALEAGATGCTNNPSFTWKILSNPAERDYFLPLMDDAIRQTEDDNEAECILQRSLVKDVSDLMMPLYRESHGRYGYVSIQGDPVHEHDPKVILAEGRLHRELNPNVCIKIPATEAGLEAMRVLLSEDTPVNATEIMSVSQGMDVCRIYREVCENSGHRPPIFLSFISGILNEYLRKAYFAGAFQLDEDVLWQAGAIVGRKMYRRIREGNYPITMLSGGVRENADFTDFVGGNVAITVNWLGNGSASSLLEANPRVIPMIGLRPSEAFVDELRARVPDFRRAYDDGGLAPEEYADFGPVALFRGNFLDAWAKAITAIASRRRELEGAART